MVYCEYEYIALDNYTTNRLVLARGYTAGVTLLISLVFFIFALCNLVRKYWRFHKEPSCCCRFLFDFITSPFLLLAVVSLLPITVYWLIILRYSTLGRTNDLDDDFCKLPGYLLVWFESSETLALAVFSLYFLFCYIPRHSKNSAMLVPREYEEVRRRRRRRNYGTQQQVQEAPPEEVVEYKAKVPRATAPYWGCGIFSLLTYVAIVVVCGLYTCPYFVGLVGPDYEEYGYALDGPWCWIKPVMAQKHFWLFEEWMYMGVTTVALVCSLIVLLCVIRPSHAKFRPCPDVRWDKTVMVPFGIFFVYFVVQFGLMVVEILVRLCGNSDDALWYTYAIGKPLSKILLVIAALQLMSTSYRMGKRREGALLAPET